MLTVSPFLQMACLLMIGIYLHHTLLAQQLFPAWVIVLVGVVSLGCGIVFYWKRQWRGALLCLSFVTIGVGYIASSIQSFEKHQLEQSTSKAYQGYLAVIKSLPEKRASTYRYEVEVTHIERDSQWVKLYARALIQVPLDIGHSLAIGSVIRVNHPLKKPISSQNPGSFDYAEYLSNQGIYFVDYLRSSQFTVQATVSTQYNVPAWSYRISAWADEVFRSHLPNEDAYGLVKAMILGRRDDLRAELVDAFTISGAVHILSVSGLHVGIFFIVIRSLLGFLKRYRYGKYIQLGLLSFFLLVYGLMTGMPPSVERSVVMCLFLAIASTFERNHVPLNTLGIAAVVILLLDPLAFYTIGFQLSFLAMVGLMVFSKPIEQLWSPSNRVVCYVWGMIAATLAAQLTTLPLTLYYFHQFPTWFLLINPAVIAISSVLLPASFLLLVVYVLPFSYLIALVAWVVDITARMTNQLVEIPTQLPWPVIDAIGFSTSQMVLLMIGLVVIAWLGIVRKDRLVFPVVLCLSVLFCGCTLGLQWKSQSLKQLVIHAFDKQYGISILENGHLFVILEKPLNVLEYKYVLKDYKAKNRIRVVQYVYPNECVQAATWSVTWLDQKPVIQYYHQRLSSVLATSLTNTPSFYMPTNDAEPTEVHDSTKLVLSTQLTYKKRQEWLSFIKNSPIDVIDIAQQGAYIMTP